MDHPGVRHVVDRLRVLGARGEVHVLASSARTAVEAADSLGVGVGQIVNSLVFDAAGRPVLVLTSGAHRVDVDVLAELRGLPALRQADPDFVRTHTGQAIGGVSPVGHPHPVTTFVDVDLAGHAEVWAAAGHPHAVFPTTFEELLALTGGAPTRVV